ncbi:MAG: TlpA disulfide reductase family protein [Proteobacteria bacterium]|nr:TlpA disulfide reductase family protein [Pseudomonadota bacterium]
MKQQQHSIIIALTALLCLLVPAAASNARIIEPGDALPRLSFEQPLSAEDKNYLRLPDEGGNADKPAAVAINDLDAELLVIEFLNCYCPSCQSQVPLMNAAYRAIEGLPDFKQQVRIIGVASGNSFEEVAAFKKEKEIPFPIFQDPDFTAYDAIGTPDGTPFTILARRVIGRFIVLSTHLGRIGSAEELASDIQNALTSEPAAIQAMARAKAQPLADGRMLKLKLPEQELRTLIIKSMRAAVAAEKTPAPIRLAKIVLPKSGVIYRGEGAGVTLYAKVISRKPTCDVCHGIHFIIVFNHEGIITNFTPIYLTKYGNIKWSAADIAFLRERIVGRSVLGRKTFNHTVDAVSTATMSSALIFNSLNKLPAVFNELKEADKR